MVHPKHIRFHHAIGISRIKNCIAQCFYPTTATGTIFSHRFDKSFDNLLDNL
jgi:hypothetical protein